MRRSKDIGVALVGLLVVAAISVAAGSGKKPAKEQQAAISLRQISEHVPRLVEIPSDSHNTLGYLSLSVNLGS